MFIVCMAKFLNNAEVLFATKEIRLNQMRAFYIAEMQKLFEVWEEDYMTSVKTVLSKEIYVPEKEFLRYDSFARSILPVLSEDIAEEIKSLLPTTDPRSTAKKVIVSCIQMQIIEPLAKLYPLLTKDIGCTKFEFPLVKPRNRLSNFANEVVKRITKKTLDVQYFDMEYLWRESLRTEDIFDHCLRKVTTTKKYDFHPKEVGRILQKMKERRIFTWEILNINSQLSRNSYDTQEPSILKKKSIATQEVLNEAERFNLIPKNASIISQKTSSIAPKTVIIPEKFSKK